MDGDGEDEVLLLPSIEPESAEQPRGAGDDVNREHQPIEVREHVLPKLFDVSRIDLQGRGTSHG